MYMCILVGVQQYLHRGREGESKRIFREIEIDREIKIQMEIQAEINNR